MKLTTRSRFGTRLMLDIAQHGHKGPVTMQEIADRQQVSKKYLEQVARPLRQAGYLKAIRGPKGGYLLKKDPKDIVVGEVVALLEAPHRSHCIESPESCVWFGRCFLQPIVEDAFTALYERLNRISFQDLLAKGKRMK